MQAREFSLLFLVSVCCLSANAVPHGPYAEETGPRLRKLIRENVTAQDAIELHSRWPKDSPNEIRVAQNINENINKNINVNVLEPRIRKRHRLKYHKISDQHSKQKLSNSSKIGTPITKNNLKEFRALDSSKEMKIDVSKFDGPKKTKPSKNANLRKVKSKHENAVPELLSDVTNYLKDLKVKQKTKENCEPSVTNGTKNSVPPVKGAPFSLVNTFDVGSPKAKKTSSVHDGKNITLCWIETLTIKEDPAFNPPKRLVLRDYTVRFENSAKIPKEDLECTRLRGEITPGDDESVCHTSIKEAIIDDVKRSGLRNHTTIREGEKIIVFQRRSIKCVSGGIVMKDEYEWPDDQGNPKKRVEIKIAPQVHAVDPQVCKKKKLVELQEDVSECDSCESSESKSVSSEKIKTTKKPQKPQVTTKIPNVAPTVPTHKDQTERSEESPEGSSDESSEESPEKEVSESSIEDESMSCEDCDVKNKSVTSKPLPKHTTVTPTKKVTPRPTLRPTRKPSPGTTSKPKEIKKPPKPTTKVPSPGSSETSASESSIEDESMSCEDCDGKNKSTTPKPLLKHTAPVPTKKTTPRPTSRPTQKPTSRTTSKPREIKKPTKPTTKVPVPESSEAPASESSSEDQSMTCEDCDEKDKSVTLKPHSKHHTHAPTKNVTHPTQRPTSSTTAKSRVTTAKPVKKTTIKPTPTTGTTTKKIPTSKPKIEIKVPPIKNDSSTIIKPLKIIKAPRVKKNDSDSGDSQPSTSCSGESGDGCQSESSSEHESKSEEDKKKTVPSLKKVTSKPKPLNKTTTKKPVTVKATRLPVNATTTKPTIRPTKPTKLSTEIPKVKPSVPRPLKQDNTTQFLKTLKKPPPKKGSCEGSKECDTSKSESCKDCSKDSASATDSDSCEECDSAEKRNGTVMTTEPTIMEAQKSRTLGKVPTTAEARRSTEALPGSSKNRHKLALRIKVLLEHINERKEKEKLLHLEKHLLLNETPGEHGNTSLLRHLKSLNNSVNVKTLHEIFNKTRAENLTEVFSRMTEYPQEKVQLTIKEKGKDGTLTVAKNPDARRISKTEKRRRREISGFEKKEEIKREAIERSLSGVEEDFHKGIGHVLTRLSRELESPKNVHGFSGISAKEKGIDLGRRKRATESEKSHSIHENTMKGEEIDRWSNERFVNAADGGRVRSLLEFKIMRDPSRNSGGFLSS